MNGMEFFGKRKNAVSFMATYKIGMMQAIIMIIFHKLPLYYHIIKSCLLSHDYD